MTLRALILSLSSLAPVVAVCADAPPPPPQDVWTGKGQLGFVESQGNTDSKSAHAAIDMAYYDAPWKHAFHLGGLYGQSAGLTAAERWDALWQSDYELSTNLFTFGALRYARDLFSGFQYQATAPAGLGYKIINTDVTKLSGQIGVGYRKLRPEELVKDAAGAVIERIPEDSSSGAVLTAGLDYSQALSEQHHLIRQIPAGSRFKRHAVGRYLGAERQNVRQAGAECRLQCTGQHQAARRAEEARLGPPNLAISRRNCWNKDISYDCIPCTLGASDRSSRLPSFWIGFCVRACRPYQS